MNNTFAIDLGTNNIKIYNAATDKIMVQKNMIAIEHKRCDCRHQQHGAADQELYNL